MSFYYPSIFSFIFVAVLYAVVLGMVWLIWVKLAKRKFKGPAVWSVVALVMVAPWLEEFWIAWHFGQLCRKDAGIFINKVVEVEGYYDATAGLHQINKPVLPVTAEDFERRGFKYYEMSLVNMEGEPGKVAHFEKVNGEWSVKALDKPVARHHYQWPHSHAPVTYKIKAHEWVIEDVENKTVIAREKAYAREAYWFYIGLDRPTIFCPVFGNHGEKLTGGLYRLALKPLK